jgi:hypothetical protein
MKKNSGAPSGKDTFRPLFISIGEFDDKVGWESSYQGNHGSYAFWLIPRATGRSQHAAGAGMPFVLL